jgi:CRISPR-associated endoribonuclease Cas6
MRIKLDLRATPQRAAYTDSINAALVAGMVAAGAKPEDVVGMTAKPWTFGVEGRSERKGIAKIFSLTVSTPDPELGEILARLNPDEVRCASSNGDTLYFGAASRTCIDTTSAKNRELMVSFASPFVVPLQKANCRSKAYADDLSEVDLDAALRVGLESRAGRSLDLSFNVDLLSRMTNVSKRVVPLRKSPRGPIYLPAFSVPMTLRGKPEDVEFAFLAGLGAKTRAGFGCPIFMK